MSINTAPKINAIHIIKCYSYCYASFLLFQSQNFQENVLQPRKESEIERKTAEFYRFGKLWRGPGYKLKVSDTVTCISCVRKIP